MISASAFSVLDQCAQPEGKRALTEAIISPDKSRDGLLKVAAAGVLSGILTPLLVPLIDTIDGTSGDFRIALVAIPFAALVLIVVRRCSLNPWWAALLAALVLTNT